MVIITSSLYKAAIFGRISNSIRWRWLNKFILLFLFYRRHLILVTLVVLFQIVLLEVKKFPRKLRNFIEIVKFWQKKSVFALSKIFFKKRPRESLAVNVSFQTKKEYLTLSLNIIECCWRRVVGHTFEKKVLRFFENKPIFRKENFCKKYGAKKK